jgi:peptide/nickel transport system substrate-binding protein
VGTGPYKIASIDQDTTGAVTLFNLSPFSRFTLGEAHIDTITLRLYPNEDAIVKAFNDGQIDAIAGLSAEQVDNIKLTNSAVAESTLPRVFAVFLNQTHAAPLADSSVRLALDTALDKTRLVKYALGGFGEPLSGPIPSERAASVSFAHVSSSTVSTAYTLDSIAASKSVLQKGGWTDANGQWKKGSQTLSFALATADTPELVETANAVAAAWRQADIQVDVQIYPLSELNSTVIRPRNYDAILFGEVIGREPDFYAFWHSSQRNDPGLNLSLYANAKADTLLSQARATTKTEEREKLYNEFASLIQADRPAIFLYAPDFLYVLPKDVQHVRTLALTTPSERFLNVYQWYTDTESVWEIFAKRMNETL